MKATPSTSSRTHQRGVALIALLAVIALGASWYLVSALNDNTANRLAFQRAQNAKVLEQAKRALLGWAALNAADTTDINPGRLPCPEDTAYYYDANNEGTAKTTCADASSRPVIGRLPWRTLGIPKLLDASGEPLWYVVSNGWKLNTANSAIGINSNSAGQLTLGTQMPVAIIIAPGPVIAVEPTPAQLAAGCEARTQSRSISSPTLPDYRDYLECENATSPIDATFATSVIDNGTNSVFNDQLVPISAAEVMNAIEGPVAKRIQTVIVPELQTGSTQWTNSSAATPIFPFAASFASGGTFNPDSYKGSLGTTQGLLPLTYAQNCNPLVDTRCSDTFVQWNTSAGSITVSRLSGATLDSGSCIGTGLSSGSQITCKISYSHTCSSLLGAITGSTCTVNVSSIDIAIAASALNVGYTFRLLSTTGVGISANLSSPNVSASLGSTSTATATTSIQGTLPSASASCDSIFILGIFVPCTASHEEIVTVPITIFQDHPLLNPAATDAWYWFIANKWYDVTYYAVANSHLSTLGATHNCSTSSDCLTVTGGTPPSSVRVLVALAGRSLVGTTGSNRSLTDFLDSGENQNGDRAFEQKTITYKKGSEFNDRFVTVSNY